MNSLRKKFVEKIVPKAQRRFKLHSPMAVFHMKKIVINIGTGQALQDEKLYNIMQDTLSKITGQKPVATKAKKSISNFKIKRGMNVGLRATLRGERMYDFAEKLIHITLPRIRDFRGLRPEAVDKQGNLTIGIREHNAFPEVSLEEVEKLHGLEISIHMTGNDKEQSEYVLREMGFPFAKVGEVEKAPSSEIELKPQREDKKENKE